MHKYGLELLLWTGSYEKENIPLISHAKELGFDGVEIHLGHPDKVPVRETRDALRQNNMEVNFAVTLTDDTNPLSSDPAVRKRGIDFFKKCIDVANDVSGTRRVINFERPAIQALIAFFQFLSWIKYSVPNTFADGNACNS